MLDKVDFYQAKRLILENTTELDHELVDLPDADGRVFYEDIYSDENIPPFSRSPFDGYALIASDTAGATNKTPVKLSLLEEIPAGSVGKKNVIPGYAAKILTGAPIPDGADLVVKFEDVVFDEKSVTISRAYLPGNICPAGEDIKKGDLIAKKGQIIDAGLSGMLAGLGISEFTAYKKPRAALISTGNELMDINEQLILGKIRNSSVYTLKSLLSSAHTDADIKGIVKDSIEDICAAVKACVSEYDVIITTGGVSVGDYDYMPRVIEKLGAKKLFWKIKMKPGGAMLAAIYEKKLIFCLSGNPAAAAVSLIMAVIPSLKKMSGITDYDISFSDAYLSEDFEKKSPLLRFVPARTHLQDKKLWVKLPPTGGNGILSPLCGVDCVAMIPAGSDSLKKGDTVKIYFI